MTARRSASPREAGEQDSFSRAQSFVLSLAAIAVFIAVALWCVRSVLPRWQEAYAGNGELEGWLWRYWWMKQLILDAWSAAPVSYTVHTALVSGSYPETGNVFDLQLLSLPLDALFGSPAHYNIKVVLVLVLNGLAGYLLARLLVEDWSASLLCGFTFAFASYVLLEIDTGRIRQALIFPLALYACALMRLSSARASMGWAVVAGVAFGLCSSVFLFYGMSAAFMTILWLVWLAAPPEAAPRADAETRRAAFRGRLTYTLGLLAVVCGLSACVAAGASPGAVQAVCACLLVALVCALALRDGRQRVAQLVVLLLVAVCASLPYATWYVEQAFVKHQALPEVAWMRAFPSLEVLENPHNVHQSDDALLNSMQRFRGDSVSWDFPFTLEYRRSIPIALTVLVLGGVLLFSRRPWLFVGMMMLGYLLSLGPYLKGGFMEEYLFRPHGMRMPQAIFFEYVPFFSRLFSPIRMEGLFLVGFAPLVAWSAARLFQRFAVPPPVRVVTSFALIAVSLSQMGRAGVIPLRTMPVQVPDVYPWIAASDASGVLELPLREGDYVNYYQIFHGKRVLDGWASGSVPDGYPVSNTKWLSEVPPNVNPQNPFLQWLRASNGGAVAAPDAGERSGLKDVASQGYRWALLHERGCYVVKGPDGRAHYLNMRRLLDTLLGPPVKSSVERVAERGAATLSPDADGLYGYEVVVYDLKPFAR